MSMVKELKPVVARPGTPLYELVQHAIVEAIESGVFQPGEQIPSTQHLSRQLAVSLVTTHRALQELVSSGVLRRSQGRGTFVEPTFFERKKAATKMRIGLVLHKESSIADYYHGQIIEGVRQASNAMGVDLILLRFNEDLRNECNGYLYVNPLEDDVSDVATSGRKQPVVVVGARSNSKGIVWVDTDNVDIGVRALEHLHRLGHRDVALVGGSENVSNSRDRRTGFLQACRERKLNGVEAAVGRSIGWKLDDTERAALVRVLSGPRRPTAVFAAGYYFALDAYSAAVTAGLRVPDELSIVGVDDPPSAPHLSPPLTTMRQPLVQLGYQALTLLSERISEPDHVADNRLLKAELVIRQSSGPKMPQS